MDFLVDSARQKIVRTVLYDDQEFHRFELELLHTPLFQRLYDLKQLGYSDRVFPDAIHSRFNHLLGVAEVAERMSRRIIRWLERHVDMTFAYSLKKDGEWIRAETDGGKLKDHVTKNVPVVRLMGLLHDITHGAFGHTLEDEVSVFSEKHDAPERQIRFFDALTAQLVTLWAAELRVHSVDILELEKLGAFDIDRAKIREWAAEIGTALMAHEGERKALVRHLNHLETAFRLLLCLDEAHSHARIGDERREELSAGCAKLLLITEVAREIDIASSVDVNIHRDLFLIDIVANTICADLIDYARRDATNAGLRASFDQRLIRYLCLVTVSGEFVPDGRHAIRTAVQIYTNKLRNDVLTEMSLLLKARYLIAERITFHPTKCAAGACLGTAVQLIGLSNLPHWVQALGDQAFLNFLMRCTEGLEAVAGRAKTHLSAKKSTLLAQDAVTRPAGLSDLCGELWPTEPRFAAVIAQCAEAMGICARLADTPGSHLKGVNERARSAQRVLWRLGSRRLPKLVYRLHGAVKSGEESSNKLAQKYNQPAARYDLERKIETACNLPLGTVHIHCPVRTTIMKAAEALVVGSELAHVSHLRTVSQIYVDHDPHELAPYEQEIRAVEEMYRSIWNFHVYIDLAHADKAALVAAVVAKEVGLKNDPLLKNQSDDGIPYETSVYDVLADRMNEFAWDQLPQVTARIENSIPMERYRRRGRRNAPPNRMDRDELESLVTDAINAAAVDRAVEVRKRQPGKPDL